MGGCKYENSINSLNGLTMGTSFSIKWKDNPENENINVREIVGKTLSSINHAMSIYIDKSEISQFNKLKMGEQLKPSADFLKLILLSKEIYDNSNGAFDITIGKEIEKWGFGKNKKKPDNKKMLTKHTMQKHWNAFVYDKEKNSIYKKSDFLLDMNGIAKGFAVDKIAQQLEEKQIHHYMIEIGGEVKVKGEKSPNKPWIIGIESPNEDKNKLSGKISSKENRAISVASSGDYRNYWELDGDKYSHIINPRTGKPIGHKTVATSVILENCAEADAWATAMLVLGESEGLAIANKLKIPVLFISKDEKFKLNTVSNNLFKEYLNKESR